MPLLPTSALIGGSGGADGAPEPQNDSDSMRGSKKPNRKMYQKVAADDFDELDDLVIAGESAQLLEATPQTEDELWQLYKDKGKQKGSSGVDWGECCDTCKEQFSAKSAVRGLWGSLEFLKWLPSYSISDDGAADLSAGITVGVVLVAQGIAYGLLAGLPGYYGLYAGIAPAFVYALFGTSRQMHIGPFALVSLLVGEGVGAAVDLEVDSINVYIDATLTMSLMVGLMFLSLWVLKLGFIVNLISDPMMSAMTTAAAFLICTSQLKHFFGLDIGHPEGFTATLAAIYRNFGEVNLVAVLIAVTSILILLVIKKINKKYKFKFPIPSQLVVVILSTAVVYFAKLDVAVLGEVPVGLPMPRIPDTSRAPKMVEGSAVVCLVSFALCIATAKTFADKNGYEIDPNQELLALGLANVVGGLFQAYPAASSLSRSALANAVGARTQIWNFISCIVIVLVLLIFTPALKTLPNAALAGIIMVAFQSILEQMTEVFRLWNLNVQDCFVWSITFASTLFLGVQTGISMGVLASVAVLLLNTMRPPIAVLGRLPKTSIYRNIARYPEAAEERYIMIYRFEANLHFGNRDYFKKQLFAKCEDRASHGIRFVVLDFSCLVSIDSSAVTTLKKLLEDPEAIANATESKQNVEILLAACRGSVRDMMQISGVTSSPQQAPPPPTPDLQRTSSPVHKPGSIQMPDSSGDEAEAQLSTAPAPAEETAEGLGEGDDSELELLPREGARASSTDNESAAADGEGEGEHVCRQFLNVHAAVQYANHKMRPRRPADRL